MEENNMNYLILQSICESLKEIEQNNYVNTTRKNFDKIVNKTSKVYDKIEVINKRLDLIDKKIDNINECLIKLINRGII